MSSGVNNLLNNDGRVLHHPVEIVIQKKEGVALNEDRDSQLIKNVSQIHDLTGAEKYYALGSLVQVGADYMIRRGFDSALGQIGLFGALMAFITKYIATIYLVPEDAPARRSLAKWNIFVPIVGPLHSIYTVAANSLSKLGNCVRHCRSEPKKALQNGLVHLVNLADATARVYNIVKIVQFVREASAPSWETDGQTHTAAEFAHLNAEQRLSSPELNPGNKWDAEIMMGIDPDCQAKGLCDNLCSAVRKTFRKVSLGVHPDKRGPQFTAVFQRLNTAKDTLNAAYKC